MSALAALKDSGISIQQMTTMTGANRSTVYRWMGGGGGQPDYALVYSLARAVWRSHPELARELVEASGYAWAEPQDAPEPPVVIPSALEREIRHWAYTQDEAEETLADMRERRRRLLSGQHDGAPGDEAPTAS